MPLADWPGPRGAGAPSLSSVDLPEWRTTRETQAPVCEGVWQRVRHTADGETHGERSGVPSPGASVPVEPGCHPPGMGMVTVFRPSEACHAATIHY